MTQKLLVHFINRGYGTDDGHKSVDVLGFNVCEFSGKPVAEIRSPYGVGGTLVAEYTGKEWLCDLD